jgi:hypothetical protein
MPERAVVYVAVAGCLDDVPDIEAAEDDGAERVAASGRDHERVHGEHHEQRRQEPPRAPRVEAGQRDPAVLGELLEQQRGDQEAREDEEEIDSRVAARWDQVEVQPDDERNRDRADAVERRNVPETPHPGRSCREPNATAA